MSGQIYRTYSPELKHSYFRDVALAAVPEHREHRDAAARLNRYSRELATEVTAGSAEGRRAVQITQTRARSLHGVDEGRARQEVRGMTTGSTSGGAFVTPNYLDARYAAMFRANPPSFLEQTVKLDDPGYGMAMYVPSLTSDLTVSQQSSENAAIGDAGGETGGFLTANLVTLAGEIVISQQLLDRAPDPGFDEIAHSQLQIDLDAAADSYVLTQALANAGTVTRASYTNAGSLWSDLAQARKAMETNAGTRVRPSHIFMTSTWHEYSQSLVDSQARPLLTPMPFDAVLPIGPDKYGGLPTGYTGERILSTPVFRDDNIPASGSNTQFVVASMVDVFTQSSTPAVRAFPETLAENLSVVVQLFAYVGVVIRHNAAVQAITGAAYPSAVSFA